MNSEKVNIENLKLIAADIKKKKDEIITIYDMKIKTIIDYSHECIVMNGDSFERVEKEFADLFNELDLSLMNLADILSNKIIPNYEDLSLNIKEYFNNQFALELEEILNMEDKTE